MFVLKSKYKAIEAAYKYIMSAKEEGDNNYIRRIRALKEENQKLKSSLAKIHNRKRDSKGRYCKFID